MLESYLFSHGSRTATRSVSGSAGSNVGAIVMNAHPQPKDLDLPPHSPVSEILATSEMFGVDESDERILERIGRLFATVLAADCVALCLYNHALTRITSAVYVGLTPLEEVRFNGVLSVAPLDIPVERAVIANGRAIQRATADEFALYPLAAADDSDYPHSDLVVPLRLGERPLGVAYIWQRRESVPLGSAEVDVAEVIAHHAALGLQASRDMRRLRALNEIGRRLAAANDVDEMITGIREAIVAVLDIDAFAFVLRERRNDEILQRVWRSTGPSGAMNALRPFERVTVDSEAGVAGRINGNQNIFPTGASGFGDRVESWIDAPLRSGGEELGVLSIGGAAPNAFAPADIELLETIASQAAVAIVNARALSAANTRLASLALLNRVTEAINATLDIESICAALDAELSAELGADAFMVGLTPVEGEADDEQQIRVIHQRDQVGIFAGGISESMRATIWYALHSGEVVSNSDPADVRSVGGIHFANIGLSPGQTIAVLPMRTGDIAIGAFCLAADREHAWGHEKLRVLATIARSAALAIENARLYAGVANERVRIGQLAVWQHALLEGGRIITQGNDINTMVDAVARQLELLLPHTGFAMYTFDQERRRLSTVIVRGSGKVLSVGWELEPGRGLNWAAVETGEPLLVNNAHLDPRTIYPPGDPVDPTGGEHEIVAPLVVDGRTIGSVCLAREGGAGFTEHEFEIFTAFAPHLAIALQTAQLVERNRTVHISTIRALTAIIDAKDPLTAGHSKRVGELARHLARELGSTAAEQRTIELAGLLHDIGKVGIPDDILAKPGPLTADQRCGDAGTPGAGGRHPALGRRSGTCSTGPARPTSPRTIRRRRLSGRDLRRAIPFGAAVIAVAEAYDMLTTERPYRSAESPDDRRGRDHAPCR